MMVKTRQFFLFCLITGAMAVFAIAGSGFFRDILASSDETYKQLKTFSDVIEHIEENYVDPVDTKDLIQKAIQGMVHSLDPHSMYLPPDAYNLLKDDTKGEFSGVGIVITMRKGFLTVVSPIEGSPAYKAGVKSDDIIVKVDGEATEDMSLGEVVKKIKGPEGTEVIIITVIRKGEPKSIDFQITRNVIPIESVKYILLKPGYGYTRIYNFTEKTTNDLEEALNEMESADTKMQGLVIDLRDNPGGLLPQALGVSDLFLDEGDILSIKGRFEEQNDGYKATPDDVDRSYPIVVIINGGSASASEIVAGALQDNKRALILGTTSFGKGSVQTVKPLKDGSGLKLTIARYYTPSGRSIQAKGIVPDIELKRMTIKEEEVDASEDYYFKEKDLKNHLEAVPNLNKNEMVKEPEGDTDAESGPEEKEGYKVINLKELMSDNQVKHALDTLVSYNVFKHLKEKAEPESINAEIEN